MIVAGAAFAGSLMLYVAGYFAVSRMTGLWSRTFDRKWQRQIFMPMAKFEAMVTGKPLCVSDDDEQIRYCLEP